MLPAAIEFDDRRRRVAALARRAGRFGARERELGAIEVPRIVAAVNDPDVIVDRSTVRPIVCPNTQLLGIGFGQNGSTSKRGTCFACAAALSSMPCTTPSVARTATNAAPVTYLAILLHALPLAGTEGPAQATLCQQGAVKTAASPAKRAPVYLGRIPCRAPATSCKSLSRLAVVLVALVALAPRAHRPRSPQRGHRPRPSSSRRARPCAC